MLGDTGINPTFNAKGIGAGGTDVMVAICSKTQAVNIRIPKKLQISQIKKDGFDYSFKGNIKYVDLLKKKKVKSGRIKVCYGKFICLWYPL